MPHATNQYGFEWKILEWATRFSKALCADPHVPFLIVLSADGHAEQIHFGRAPEEHDEDVWRQLRTPASAWFAYDPFEGPVHTHLSWQLVPRAVFERLLGAPLVAVDTTAGPQIDFPDTWSVMF